MSYWANMHDRVEAYLNARRSLGYKLKVEGQELARFARFAENRRHQQPLTVGLAIAWANSSRRGSALYGARRLEIIRGLAKYCFLFEPETEVPLPGLLGPAHRRVTPYIYAKQEIDDLLAAAAHLAPTDGLRPITMRCFLGLLAATGMRVSEALHLSRADVDFQRAVLTVRETKFRKSRYVPLHPTAVEALNEYTHLRDRHFPLVQCTAFFLDDGGRELQYRQALHAFQVLRKQLGWKSREGRYPRLYDLRHTFACRRLLACYKDGSDVGATLPLLSTYLGHGKVTDTYWYLTGIPALMAIAGERFERLAQSREEVNHG